MSLQDKFTTFIKYVIIQLVTNNNIDIRDYDRNINSVKSTLKNELNKHNNNFELAIESTAKLLTENEYIISQIKIMYPDKYTEDVTNDDVDKDCCDDDKDCCDDDEDCCDDDEDCCNDPDKDCYDDDEDCCDDPDKDCCDDDKDCCNDPDKECCDDDEDCCDNERDDFYNFIISYSGLYQVHNLHPDETSKMSNKLFKLLSQ